jgi:hypothetical protein
MARHRPPREHTRSSPSAPHRRGAIGRRETLADIGATARRISACRSRRAENGLGLILPSIPGSRSESPEPITTSDGERARSLEHHGEALCLMGSEARRCAAPRNDSGQNRHRQRRHLRPRRLGVVEAAGPGRRARPARVGAFARLAPSARAPAPAAPCGARRRRARRPA